MSLPKSIIPIGLPKKIQFSARWSHDVGYSVGDDTEIVVATVYGETSNECRQNAETFAKAVNAGLLCIKFEPKVSGDKDVMGN
jgi:hypothetical protein